MSPDVALPQFNILGHRQRIVEASLSSGNYSRLLADVQFDRALGYYLIQVTYLYRMSDVLTPSIIYENTGSETSYWGTLYHFGVNLSVLI